MRSKKENISKCGIIYIPAFLKQRKESMEKEEIKNNVAQVEKDEDEMTVAEYARLHPEEDPDYKYEHMNEFEKRKYDKELDDFMWQTNPKFMQAWQNLTETVEQLKKEDEIMEKVHASTSSAKTAKVLTFPKAIKSNEES